MPRPEGRGKGLGVFSLKGCQLSFGVRAAPDRIHPTHSWVTSTQITAGYHPVFIENKALMLHAHVAPELLFLTVVSIDSSVLTPPE
jgi:hypothetical protein